jgi:PAS domain S-box-containing protein
LSSNCSSLISRPLDEILGKTVQESGVLESLHPDDREPLFEAFREGIKSDKETRSRFRLRDPDGSWRCFEGVSTPCKQADGSRRVLSICHDVTDVVQARLDHQETEELYRIVTDVSRDMIVEANAAGKLVFANRSVEDITGYTNPELVGKEYISFFELVHPDDRERIVRQYEKQKAEPGNTVHYPPYRFKHKDGSWIWFSTIGTWYERASGEIRMLEVSRDISQEIQREEERIEIARQMLETQKLESLGVMAGGITHDFNNLLTPILGDAQLALLDLPPDSPVRPRIEQIHHAAKRAAALTRQMLAYSGQTPISIEPLSFLGSSRRWGSC